MMGAECTYFYAIMVAALCLLCFLLYRSWKSGSLLYVIRRSRDRFKALVDLSPYGIALTAKDGIIISANRALAQLLDMDVRELVGASLPGMLGLDTEDISRRAVGLRPGQVLRLPGLDIKGKGNVVRHIRPCLFSDESDKELFFWHIQDQTTHFQLEKRFEELVESVPVGLFWAETDGLINAVNQEFLHILKTSKRPDSLEKILSHSHWQEAKKILKGNGDNYSIHVEKELNGQSKHLRIQIRYCAYGGSAYLAGIVEDITLETRLKQQLEDACRKAEAASQAKGTFLSNMSHELRTPLNVILGMATILEDKIIDREAVDLVADLKKASEHITSLIGDILDLAKIESGKLTLEEGPFDLKELMDGLEAVLGVQARLKDLDFVIRFPEEMHRYYRGDPVRIRQIIFNLAGNSLKFTQKGFIEVAITDRGKGPGHKRRLVIRVRDTGPGICEDVLPTLFDPFVQAEQGRKVGGTGLGLSIAQELAAMMDGSIRVESELGKGTEFLVEIGLEPVDAGLVVEKRPKDLKDPKPGKVLIADDAPMNRKILRVFLEKRGWKIFEAENGRQVLDILETNTDIDLILMDISMPEMDGIEAARQIKGDQRLRHIPIIAVTAHAMSDDREKFLQAGMEGYVSKPVRIESLMEEIAQVNVSIGCNGKEKKTQNRVDIRNHSQYTKEDGSEKTGPVQIPDALPVDFKALLKTCQGMEDLARDLLLSMLEECPKWLKQAEKAVSAKDPKEIRKICHLIRGSASTVHANALNNAAERLGKAAREGKEELYEELFLSLCKRAKELEIWVRPNFSIPKALDKLEEKTLQVSSTQDIKLSA